MFEEVPFPLPALGCLLSEYTTNGLWSMAFPSLFPSHFMLPRPRHLASAGVIRSQRDLSSSCHAVGQFLFLRSPDNRYMTVGQLKEAFRGDDDFVFTYKIVCCVTVKAVCGTQPYWQWKSQNIFADHVLVCADPERPDLPNWHSNFVLNTLNDQLMVTIVAQPDA